MDTGLIQAIGSIQSSVDNLTKEVGLIRVKQDEQSTKIQDIVTSFAVYRTHGDYCKREFQQINDKLGRDFKAINMLTKESEELKTISNYKGKIGNKFKIFLGIVATVLSIIIATNQIVSIKSKVSLNPVNAVYALPCDTIRGDSLDPFNVR